MREGFLLKTMFSKAKIKLINSLKMSKYRNEHRLFIAEGSTNVLDLLQSPIRIAELFATQNWLDKHADRLKGINCSVVNQKDFEKITALKTASEVLALFAIPEYSLLDLTKINGLVLMLDDIKDPGNLGTIIRTADWFGIHQVICSAETVDTFNPKVVQASMGSLARVEIHYHDLYKILQSKPENLPLYGAVLDGKPLMEFTKCDKGIVLIGSEAHGITNNLLQFIDHKITIPTFAGSKAESLNASIATAIICYSFRNQ